MAQKRFLGITVFGWLALVTGFIFVTGHYWLWTQTQQFVIKLLIASLGITTVVGFSVLLAARNVFTRLLVRVAFVWSFVSLLASLLFTITFALHTVVTVSSGMVWLLTVLISSWGYYRARYPVINKETITGDWDDSYTIAHVTDVHLGDVWSRSDLLEIVQMANEQQPDVVAITGDLVDGMEDVTEELLEPLQKLEAPAYFVSGNHDYYAGRDNVIELLESVKVTSLDGERAEEQGLSLVGIGHETGSNVVSELGGWLHEEEPPRVVLKHEPTELEELLASELILCGHVHGGQVWPLGYLAHLEFPFVFGSYEVADSLVHVSHGIRTWGPPFRLGTRSELGVFHLIPE